MRFTEVFTALALAASAVAHPSAPKPKNGLATAMKARGREFIGTALTLRGNATEEAIATNGADFNSFTPENAMKWEVIEPSRNNFTFTDADRYRDWAKANKKEIHCHTLVWHSQLPAWVGAGNFDNKTLIKIMENHISKLAGRYKDVCTRWDATNYDDVNQVVNEALNEDGTYRSSPFYDTIGEAFIPLAFKFAKKYSPKSELYYNDYNLEYNGNKTLGAKRIVKLIQSYGVHIDGVGLQAHLAQEVTPTAGALPDQATLETVLKGFTKLDVDVVYTEIDIRMNTPATPAKLKAQAKAFESVARSCLAIKRCVGMTVWGISDAFSWIPGVFPGEGAALLWDENLKKKSAYDGFLKGIKGGKK